MKRDRGPSDREESLARDVADLRAAVARLESESGSHRSLLSEHTVEIERLKHAHEECARFRAEMLREQESVREAVSHLGGKLGDLEGQLGDLAHQATRDRAAQDALRSEVSGLASRVGDQAAAADRLRGDVAALGRQVEDGAEAVRKLRTDVPGIVNAAVAAAEKARPPPAQPEPPPKPRALSPPKVSKEAFASLRNGDDETYELPGITNVIGRAAACEACIAGSQAISNKHASIEFDAEGRASLRDLGSRNGTFLNERRVGASSPMVIRSGDTVQLGVDGPTFMFDFGPAFYARWPREPEHADRRRGGSAMLPEGRNSGHTESDGRRGPASRRS